MYLPHVELPSKGNACTSHLTTHHILPPYSIEALKFPADMVTGHVLVKKRTKTPTFPRPGRETAAAPYFPSLSRAHRLDRCLPEFHASVDDSLPKTECSSVHVINDITWSSHLASHHQRRKSARPLGPAPFDIRNRARRADRKHCVLIRGTRILAVAMAKTISDGLAHIQATTEIGSAPGMGKPPCADVKIRALPGLIHLWHSYQALSVQYGH